LTRCCAARRARRLLRVDVTGYRRDDLGQRPPKPGDDVMLTLDTTVQQLAEDALNGVPGAIVVLDPRNGDVLAMASSPGFDPNQFVPFIRSADWALLRDGPVDAADEPRGGRRLRARQHLQAHHRPGRPGHSGKAHAGDLHDCPGYYQLGRTTFRCWKHSGHGTIALQKALEQSCNVYCFLMARAGGPEAVQEQARAFGLGRRTGIEVDYESPGLVPDDAVEAPGQPRRLAGGRHLQPVHRPGRAQCHAAADGHGVRPPWPTRAGSIRPRLVLATRAADQSDFVPREPELVKEMHWRPEYIRVVREGHA
jgi:penicillin-binding protein 2